jgi:hypothetical protein
MIWDFFTIRKDYLNTSSYAINEHGKRVLNRSYVINEHGKRLVEMEYIQIYLLYILQSRIKVIFHT